MKLHRSLKLLPKKEYPSFLAFLDTPVFNQRADVKSLFTYYVNRVTQSDTEREGFAQVFVGRSFSKKDWWLVHSRLLKLLQDYFSFRALTAAAADQKFFLAQFYRQQKSEKDFLDALNDSERLLEKENFRHTDYWQQKNKIAFSNYDYIESQNRNKPTNLQMVSDSLDIFFVASKLKHACQNISRQAISSETYQIAWLDDVLKMISQQPDYLEVPAIAIYYYCFKAVGIGGQEADFQKLRSAINKYNRFFPPNELRDIYLIATNYCIRQVNAGQKTFIREAFELYSLSLANGFLLEDGVMPESTYNNLVTLAIKLGEFSWAKKFLKDYQGQLKPIFQTPLYQLCQGKLHYAQHDHAACLLALAQVESKAPFLYLGAKTIQLKCYYELQEWDALDALLESLRVYLQRRKDLGARRANYENLHYFVRRLLNWKIMNRSERSEFIDEVEQANLFTEREWMLDKLY